MSSEPKAITRYDADQYGMDADDNGYFVKYEDHQQALAALRAEVEALRKDAERYQWLRNEAWRHPVTAPAVAVFDEAGQLVELDCEGHALDEAIDAAMENPA